MPTTNTTLVAGASYVDAGLADSASAYLVTGGREIELVFSVSQPSDGLKALIIDTESPLTTTLSVGDKCWVKSAESTTLIAVT